MDGSELLRNVNRDLSGNTTEDLFGRLGLCRKILAIRDSSREMSSGKFLPPNAEKFYQLCSRYQYNIEKELDRRGIDYSDFEIGF